MTGFCPQDSRPGSDWLEIQDRFWVLSRREDHIDRRAEAESLLPWGRGGGGRAYLHHEASAARRHAVRGRHGACPHRAEVRPGSSEAAAPGADAGEVSGGPARRPPDARRAPLTNLCRPDDTASIPPPTCACSSARLGGSGWLESWTCPRTRRPASSAFPSKAASESGAEVDSQRKFPRTADQGAGVRLAREDARLSMSVSVHGWGAVGLRPSRAPAV